jgi:Uma2 family endonuclease
MSAITSDPPVTPDDLTKMPDAVAYELVDGQLVERNVGAESSAIAAKIIALLILFLRDHRLGKVFGSDASYRCFAKAPGKIRRADVSFVRYERLPAGQAPKGNLLMAPDLAVEVVSPNDTWEEVDAKVLEWLDAGTRLVWVVAPGTRTVRIHRPVTATAGTTSMLSADDQISGEDVLPGFSMSIREFFED